MSDTPLQMFGYVIQICLGIVTLIGSYLAYAYFSDSPDKPWMGYATLSATERPEFWFASYETRRDCLEGMAYGLEAPGSEAYAEPIGCAYFGKNSWLVRVVNMWSVGDDLHCISRVTWAPSDGSRYRPVLKQLAVMPDRGPEWYCL